jgi:hypothetical protein
MATQEIDFLHSQLEERKRRLEAAIASAPRNSALAGLSHEVPFHQFVLIREKRTGDVFFALSRDEPRAVTLMPVAGRVQVSGTLHLRREQKTLSPVIGERVVAVGTSVSRPCQRW